MARRHPKITVIIPALNEAKVLGGCLKALELQDYPSEAFEIIVVDNGSTDNTAEIAAAHGATIMNETRRSAYFARNTAITQSSGEYLAFTDADCQPDFNWLTSFVNATLETSELVASGLTVYEVKLSNIANRLLAETKTPENLKRYVVKNQCIAGGNMFVSRSIFEKIGLFRLTRSGADIDFSRRAGGYGLTLRFVEDAVVRHQCDLTNLEYLKRTYGEQVGQALLSASPPSLARLLTDVGKVPWRPGISNLKAGVGEWAYRWIDRWFGYVGRVRGDYLAWRGTSFTIPTYDDFK